MGVSTLKTKSRGKLFRVVEDCPVEAATFPVAKRAVAKIA
jgi:hypothetical protein